MLSVIWNRVKGGLNITTEEEERDFKTSAVIFGAGCAFAFVLGAVDIIAHSDNVKNPPQPAPVSCPR